MDMKQVVYIAVTDGAYNKLMTAATNIAKADGGKILALMQDARRVSKDDVLSQPIIVLKWGKDSVTEDWESAGGSYILGLLWYFSSNGDGFAYAKLDLTDGTDVIQTSGGEFEGLFAVEKKIVGVDEL